MEFTEFKLAVQRNFASMHREHLYRMAVDKDRLWEVYLSSFPEGSNPLYHKRTEHDCSCCKQFIKNAGAVASIRDGKIFSLWEDLNLTGYYKVVADAMAAYIKTCKIENIFLHYENTVGVSENFQTIPEVGVIKWEHFSVTLPPDTVIRKSMLGTSLGDRKETTTMLRRALEDITHDALATTIDLIEQNSIYRGTEFLALVRVFKGIKVEFSSLRNDTERDIFCWQTSDEVSASVSRIRGSVIGTLLMDLSEDKDLEHCVKAFESKVAPMNYKRPTALVSKVMVQKAREKVEELGLTASLNRRFAVLEDVKITNLLFVDRSTRRRISGAFDEVEFTATKSNTNKNLSGALEISVSDFISNNILKNVEAIEVLLENRHIPNLVSLIAPADPTAKNMFKWNNPFSWAYKGDVTDSIKERVKAAGGSVTGIMRCSLSWSNFDDLDLHCRTPQGNHIYYMNKRFQHDGCLDVDMNAGRGHTRIPVENITFEDKSRLRPGVYEFFVNQYSRRDSTDIGFEVELELDGVVHRMKHTDAMSHDETVPIAKVEYTKDRKFILLTSLPTGTKSQVIWGLPTESFHKVSLVMFSPNYWNRAIGNMHFFFMLENCVNDEGARGFFNEYLVQSLDPYRKVLELVGSRVRVEKTENQMSGVGFSSTIRNDIVVKATGSHTRTYKIYF